MIVIGLTGSIGMGKSTAAAMFRDCGAPVYDADAAVHRLYQGGDAGQIGAQFPKAFVDGAIDRKILSKIVLQDDAELKRLEGVVHPLLRGEREEFVNQARREGRKFCILDVPLLFETGAQSEVDVVVVVSAPAQEQERRVLSRGTLSREQFEIIRSKQWPDRDKRRNAHFIVETGFGLAEAERQVRGFLRALGG